MATAKQNSFTSYDLTEAETLSGSLLSETNLYLIQNQISAIAEQKLALTVTPTELSAFLQQEAYLSGQMDALKYLVDLNDQTRQNLTLDNQE